MVLLLFKGFHITNSCPATCGFPVSGFHLLCVVASQHMVVSVLQRPTYAVASQHMQLLRNLWCFSLIEFPPAILSNQVVFFSPRVSTYQSSKSGFFSSRISTSFLLVTSRVVFSSSSVSTYLFPTCGFPQGFPTPRQLLSQTLKAECRTLLSHGFRPTLPTRMSMVSRVLIDIRSPVSVMSVS